MVKDYIYMLAEQSGSMSLSEIVTNIGMSAILGLVIFMSYFLSHAGTIYSRKFNVTLLTLSVLTATVMTVIGNNVALSLGMVGALSIIRFRTAVKDSRDTIYIFWAIIVGICSGVGDYVVAAVGSAVVFCLLLVLGRVKNDERILLIIRVVRNNDVKVESLVFEFFEQKARLRVKNTTVASTELIYEINSKMLNQAGKAGKSITESLYRLEGVEYVNLVAQSDEITG